MVVVTGCSQIIILLHVYCGVTGTNFTTIFLKTPRHPLPTGTEYLSVYGLYEFQTLTPC